MARKKKKKRHTEAQNLHHLAHESVRHETLSTYPLESQEFLNREVQWLEFDRRVLFEARNGRHPLFERLRFLSIFSSNLDEFFMKRVGSLQSRSDARVVLPNAGGLTILESMTQIREHVVPMQKEQSRIFREELIPELKRKDISLLSWPELSKAEQKRARGYFRSHVFPVLTPLAVDPGHPFPFISNLSTSLAVTLKHPEREEKLFARVKVPKIFPQWVRLDEAPGEPVRFVHLIEVVTEHLGELFPAMDVLAVMPFRITRNAYIGRDEEEAEDLVEMVTEELKQRRFADAVRLETGKNPDPWMLDFLREELDLRPLDHYEVDAIIDFGDLKTVLDLKRPQLCFDPWTPQVPPAFHEPHSIFESMTQQDLLVHHPYESFSHTIEKLIECATADPKVLAIKMTLYRTGHDSAIVPMLIRAAESGKQVVCLIEVKARFDEERNIYWAQKLEEAGAHVVYGVVGLKTHCKTLLIIRQEEGGVKSYAHVGTGNYHKETSKLYTDIGLFTARPEITNEVVELFHFLTGRSLKREYEYLLVAPLAMKEKFLGLIEREVQHVTQGRPGRIIAKMNSLEDQDMGRALYKAAAAGVKIDLIVRGFCILRPGVPGKSENIRVISIVGRFLEHTRAFYFGNGAKDALDGDVFIGSADWMSRNLHSRVEVIVPIIDRALRARVLEILHINLNDRVQAWHMRSDGTYERVEGEGAGSNAELMRLARLRDAPHPLAESSVDK